MFCFIRFDWSKPQLRDDKRGWRGKGDNENTGKRFRTIFLIFLLVFFFYGVKILNNRKQVKT